MSTFPFHKLLIIFAFILFSTSIIGQNSSAGRYGLKRNTLYVEFFGSANRIYNIGYDRLYFLKPNYRMALTLGAQYLPKKLNADKAMLSFCPQVNFLYGFIHYFELGVGASYDVYTKSLTFPFRIGYRYQEQGGGIFFKIAATPMIVKADLFYTFKPWAGAAIGWTF